MSITPGTYTNPGWVNGGTPALNATNLNAISNAIVKNQTDIATVDAIADLGGLYGGTAKIHTDTFPVTIPQTSVAASLNVLNVGTVLSSSLVVSEGTNVDTIQGSGKITYSGTYLIAQAFTSSGELHYYIEITSGTPQATTGYLIVRYTLADGS